MSLKFGKNQNKPPGLYTTFFGTQNVSQRSYLSLKHRCYVNYCAFTQISRNQEQFNFQGAICVPHVRALQYMMVFIFHLLYILARISKHHSKAKVSILFCVHWMHFGVLLLTIAIEADAKIWQIYNAWRNYFLHAHPVRSLE